MAKKFEGMKRRLVWPDGDRCLVFGESSYNEYFSQSEGVIYQPEVIDRPVLGKAFFSLIFGLFTWFLKIKNSLRTLNLYLGYLGYSFSIIWNMKRESWKWLNWSAQTIWIWMSANLLAYPDALRVVTHCVTTGRPYEPLQRTLPTCSLVFFSIRG